MPVDRRRLVMAGAAAAVLVLAYVWFRPSAPAPAASPSAARPRSGTGAAVPSDAAEPVKRVRLDELKAPRDEPGEAARNPFRFQPRVVAPPPRPVAPPTAPVIEGPRPPPVPAGPPPAPPIPLKLIGVLERANGVKWAVLSDGKSAPMYGKDGDIIDGRYTIVKIGTESIEMTHADGRGRQVIRLTGQ
jgi:hypothetical protein